MGKIKGICEKLQKEIESIQEENEALKKINNKITLNKVFDSKQNEKEGGFFSCMGKKECKLDINLQ